MLSSVQGDSWAVCDRNNMLPPGETKLIEVCGLDSVYSGTSTSPMAGLAAWRVAITQDQCGALT